MEQLRSQCIALVRNGVGSESKVAHSHLSPESPCLSWVPGLLAFGATAGTRNIYISWSSECLTSTSAPKLSLSPHSAQHGQVLITYLPFSSFKSLLVKLYQQTKNLSTHHLLCPLGIYSLSSSTAPSTIQNSGLWEWRHRRTGKELVQGQAGFDP